MAVIAWSGPDTEELLTLAVDLLEARDARGLLLLRRVLAQECGAAFADFVGRALQGGAAAAAFDFLPAPSGRLRPPAAAPAAAVTRETPATAPAAPQLEDRPAPSAAPMPREGYVTAAEVAAHFGVSAKAVYRWMASGRIQAERRPGGSYRIPAGQFHPS